jgi:hypothetical protein
MFILLIIGYDWPMADLKQNGRPGSATPEKLWIIAEPSGSLQHLLRYFQRQRKAPPENGINGPFSASRTPSAGMTTAPLCKTREAPR